MRLRSRHRFRIALVVLLSLLFQQAAMAAYACNMEAAELPQAPMAAHCAGIETDQEQPPDNPALCAKHCAPDQSTLAEHLVLTAPAIQVPPVRFEPLRLPVDDSADWQDVAVVRSDPPPRLRYCSLLI